MLSRTAPVLVCLATLRHCWIPFASLSGRCWHLWTSHPSLRRPLVPNFCHQPSLLSSLCYTVQYPTRRSSPAVPGLCLSAVPLLHSHLLPLQSYHDPTLAYSFSSPTADSPLSSPWNPFPRRSVWRSSVLRRCRLYTSGAPSTTPLPTSTS